MSEVSPACPERRLWFDGPNYTADALVVNPELTKILLIQRKDTGEWALPGGFIDPIDRSSYHAAIRETHEETGLEVVDGGHCIFSGVVDDPRNTDTAWIETRAHLFTAPSESTIRSGDDASDATWHSLEDLPPLYASHRAIIDRGLDYTASISLADTLVLPDSSSSVTGGHMEYDKNLLEKNGLSVFTKQHNPERFSDTAKAQRSRIYLEKEAATMAHVRQQEFTQVPSQSILHNNTLLMQALAPAEGWQWRSTPATVDAYLHDALEAFAELESITLPAESFPIEPSYQSFAREGWQSFDNDMRQRLAERLYRFIPRLTEDAQVTAHRLFDDLEALEKIARAPRATPQFVFCHHDIRQSNIAWHPTHGIKLVDWSWAGVGEPGSDSTSLLIDLHKSGYDISSYRECINPHVCLTLIGFWLAHSTWAFKHDDTVRFQQFASALSAYEIFCTTTRQ